MSDNSNDVIGNASEIIERFGGIRPMSNKTGIPVTTIQGWKQRNVIPSNRRNELIDAANQHGIILGHLLMDIAGDKTFEMSVAEEERIQKEKMEEAKTNPDLRPSGNSATLIAAGSLILVAAIAGSLLAVTPQIVKIGKQDVRIKELEQEIIAIKNAKEVTLAGDESTKLIATVNELEGRVGALSQQTKLVAGDVETLKTATISERLSKVEANLGGILQQANAFGLHKFVEKVKRLQSTPEGLTTIQNMTATIRNTTANLGEVSQIKAGLEQLKQNDPLISEVFKDVALEDMKSAVLLLSMNQLHELLSRDNQPFEQDLQILKAVTAGENSELMVVIDKLAPQAKTGVLTSSGLARKLADLSNDIITTSLSGQNITVKDRAVAQLGAIIKIEKDGEQISGTETQIYLTEAQKKLDAGEVEHAVQALQKIKGAAADKAKLIIDLAQSTILASHVQQLVGQNIIETLQGLPNTNHPTVTGVQ